MLHCSDNYLAKLFTVLCGVIELTKRVQLFNDINTAICLTHVTIHMTIHTVV